MAQVDRLTRFYLFYLIDEEEYTNLISVENADKFIRTINNTQASTLALLAPIFTKGKEKAAKIANKYPVFNNYVLFGITQKYTDKEISNTLLIDIKELELKVQVEYLLVKLFINVKVDNDTQDFINSILNTEANYEVSTNENIIINKPKSNKINKVQVTQKLDKYETRYNNIKAKNKSFKDIIDSSGIELKTELDILKYEMEQDEEVIGIMRYNDILSKVNNSLEELSLFKNYTRYESRNDNQKLSRSSSEHISLLVERNLFIEDVIKAQKEIEQKGYFRLTGYLKKINKNDNYSNHTFNEVMEYYDLDVKIRSALMLLLEKIEVSFKYSFTNWLVDKYENYEENHIRCYRNANIYQDVSNYQVSLGRLSVMINNAIDDENPIALKYRDNIEDMPLWCICEMTTLGWFVSLFLNLNEKDKEEYVNDYYQNITLHDFIGLMTRISNFRNMCAHHNMLYKTELKEMLQFESTTNVDVRIKDTSLFSYVINMVRLIDDTEMIKEFIHLIERAESKITDSSNKLKIAYGFLSNYKQIIKDETGWFLK